MGNEPNRTTGDGLDFTTTTGAVCLISYHIISHTRFDLSNSCGRLMDRAERLFLII